MRNSPWLRFSCGLLLACLMLANGAAQAQSSLAAQRQQAIQQAVAAAAESIVRIETVGGVDVVEQQLTAAGPTSGVVLRADGLIITSRFNFVSKPASILVTLADGRKFAARMLGEDHARMLTLLKIDADGLTPLTAAPKESSKVGQTVIALGRTFDLSFPNLSTGIISALDRVWGRAVQTDAKISPVNYGGALIDLSGRGVGILAPLDPSKEEVSAGVEWYDSGIGFAIPLEDVQRVLDKLAAGETLRRGLMGVNFEDKGALSGQARILNVRAGSPAAVAGLKKDDVVTRVNGRTILKVNDLKHAVGPVYAGETVQLQIQRQGSSQEIQVRLVDELTPYLFPTLGVLPERLTDGPATVRAILPGSPAEKAGLQPGDVITSLDSGAVADRFALKEQVLRHSPKDTVQLTFTRSGASQTVSIALAEYANAAPAKSPLAKIPARPMGDGPATGRLNETLPAEGGSFWAHVPANYTPAIGWGLVIWLHPPGDSQEAETLRAWEQICRDRGVILLGPRAADVNGFSDDDATAIGKMVDWLGERYEIDETRISAIGGGPSAAFAARMAFRDRDLIRAAVLLRGGFRTPILDNDPESPLQFAIVPADDSQTKPLTALAEALRKEGFPTDLLPMADAKGGTFPRATLDALANWLDALDRI